MALSTTQTANYTEREAWLNALAKQFERTIFKDYTLPKYRITCGFPSNGARSVKQKSQTLGECFDASVSGDNTVEIIISIAIEDAMRVADVLAHEMIHAIVGNKKGHGPEFRKLAVKIGLVGKMTATTAGELFKQTVQPILDNLGAYPHASLDYTRGRKKQSTRMIKLECKCCGYVVRTSQKWIAMGVPYCPSLNKMVVS